MRGDQWMTTIAGIMTMRPGARQEAGRIDQIIADGRITLITLISPKIQAPSHLAHIVRAGV
ncbi:MAG: hypothetical protein C5B60_11300 [Chloroflexi bacterium]|nr:MAG: hypothetical protein C5B60_11300 [Chloroflexota bacterium]